jgi:Tol biopolymer transport system component
MAKRWAALLIGVLCAWAPAAATAATVSNGRIAAEAFGGGRADIVSFKANGGDWTDLTPGANPGYCQPSWSSDGTQIAFLAPDLPPTAGAIPAAELRVMNADGSGMRTLALARPAAHCFPVTWSANGHWIAYLDSSSAVQAIPASGVGAPLQLTDGDQGYHDPAWSNDGSRIAYVGDDGHLYTTAVTEVGPTIVAGAKHQVDQHGFVGTKPDWSPDDSRLAVERHDADGAGLWTVDSTDGGGGVRLTTDAPGTDPQWVDNAASWSPNGRKIAFDRMTFDANGTQTGNAIFTIDAAGGTPTEVTAPAPGFVAVGDPDWQPLPHGP